MPRSKVRPFRYSYSGADCRAFAFFPGSEYLYDKLNKDLAVNEFENSTIGRSLLSLVGLPPDPATVSNIERLRKLKADHDVEIGNLLDFEDLRTQKTPAPAPFQTSLTYLESLATLSISTHEPKAPVRRLGERAPIAFTRSVRTIGGSMIFLIIEDHPLSEVMANDPANVLEELIGWSRDLHIRGRGHYSDGTFNKSHLKLPTLISPFNILLNYQTEYAGQREDRPNPQDEIASLMIEEIEIISEGIVTSVNDMVTEVVIQFTAKNMYEFAQNFNLNLNIEENLKGAISTSTSRNKNAYRQYYQSLYDRYYNQISPESQTLQNTIVKKGEAKAIIIPPSTSI